MDRVSAVHACFLIRNKILPREIVLLDNMEEITTQNLKLLEIEA